MLTLVLRHSKGVADGQPLQDIFKGLFPPTLQRAVSDRLEKDLFCKDLKCPRELFIRTRTAVCLIQPDARCCLTRGHIPTDLTSLRGHY